MDDLPARLGTIALIGGGKMAEAIISGLVDGALFDPDNILVADPNEERRAHLSESYGVRCVADGAEIKEPDTVILAIKPQVLKALCEQLAQIPGFAPTRVISIAAGITSQTVHSFFPEAAVIRVMPNTPLTVSAGMSAVCTAEGTTHAEGELVRDLFALMGEAVLIDEAQINAVTALSGSGPAYFALFVEALTTAGVQAGLDPGLAALLSRQTMLGTARYLDLVAISPAQLREAVTSPRGTTEAALLDFESHDFLGIVQSALTAALRRADELA